jgi:hypothetical protein
MAVAFQSLMQAPPPIIYAVNGILTGQVRVSWPDLLEAWWDRHNVPGYLKKKEHLAWPAPLLNVQVVNRFWSSSIVNEIELFVGNDDWQDRPKRDIHFVAHSNGTDIALKAVKKLAQRGITTKSLIVIGSVLKPDIEQNGVRELLMRADLERAVCYCSQADWALRGGRHTLGYSELGRRGWLWNGEPVNEVAGDAPAVHEHNAMLEGCCWSRRFEGYGHSTYFDPDHREQTFALIRKDMGL